MQKNKKKLERNKEKISKDKCLRCQPLDGKRFLLKKKDNIYFAIGLVWKWVRRHFKFCAWGEKQIE